MRIPHHSPASWRVSLASWRMASRMPGSRKSHTAVPDQQGHRREDQQRPDGGPRGAWVRMTRPWPSGGRGTLGIAARL